MIMTTEEEAKIEEHVVKMQQWGYGESWESLRFLIQEVLLSIKKANPNRVTNLEDTNQLATKCWVRNFAKRHNLTLRKTSVISKGRAIISPEDIQMWFNDVGGFLNSRPDLMEALADPQRVFNQDETAVELGVGGQWVLARRNTKQVYSVSSSTREHVTVSFTVNAAGGMVQPRVVYAGVRDMAKEKLKDLPKDGQSGEWVFSYTENGWVKQKTYLDIIMDIVKFIEKHSIPLPVLLFIDGASCHLSIAMARLCLEHSIQPVLLRPNTTHLTQALDLTYFSSLKARLKKEQELWHRQNVGTALSKYSVIHLVHKVTEAILLEKPLLIGKGFRKAGICPWDPSAPSIMRMLPSQVYASSNGTPAPVEEVKPQETQVLAKEGSKEGKPGRKEGEPERKEGQPGGKEEVPERKEGESRKKEEEPEKKTEEPGKKEDESGGREGEPGKKEEGPGRKTEEGGSEEEGREVELEHPVSMAPGEGGEGMVLDHQSSILATELEQAEQENPYADGEQEKEIKSPATQEVLSNHSSRLPECTPRLLSGFEHLLPEEAVKTIHQIYGNKEMPQDPIFQAWRILKEASLPQGEKQALTEVKFVCLSVFARLTRIMKIDCFGALLNYTGLCQHCGHDWFECLG